MTEGEPLERIRSGRPIEGPEHAAERYVTGLERTLVCPAQRRLIGTDEHKPALQEA